MTTAQIAATNLILRRALRISSHWVSDLLDQLDVENFGDDTHYSCALAAAATEFGLADAGDSAYDLSSLTEEQAMEVVAKYYGTHTDQEVW